jgi:DNA mismatch repair protein MSH5
VAATVGHSEWYFKGGSCTQLDERYGDISSQIKDIECELVRLLERRLLSWLPVLERAQSCLAELDALLSLAICARDLHLTPPTLTEDDTGTLCVRGAWHPLLAASADDGSGAPRTLVPNDCELGSASERLMLLTGPNASGKTVYLRTVALVVCALGCHRRPALANTP